MKKPYYLPLFILLALFISNCQAVRTNQLEATNQALSDQVNSLMSRLTQQAIAPSEASQEASGPTAESSLPTEIPPTSTGPLPTQGAAGVTPTLIFSGSGTLTPLSIKKSYPAGIFGAANVHLICDPNDTTDGKIWIDNKNYSIGCPPNSETWTLWKPGIIAGDHYIYSQNANDTYEFWTVGSAPFKISNKFAYSDFVFMVNRQGIYNLTGDVGSGMFNLYITCEGAQNFSYTDISESMTAELVMNPAACELLIRNQPPGTLTPGEIEVSLEFVK